MKLELGQKVWTVIDSPEWAKGINEWTVCGVMDYWDGLYYLIEGADGRRLESKADYLFTTKATALKAIE